MTQTIQIEKSVPLTPPSHGAAGQRKYPFDKMSVGDSFAVPIEKNIPRNGTPREQSNLANCAKQFATKRGRGEKFATRQLAEGGRKVVRIWRVA